MRQVPGTRYPGLALAAIALLGGCDQLFKLKETSAPPDAPPCGSPDEDGDCIANAEDNCPGIANPQQVQTGESATPAGAGDACDPEPTVPGNAVEAFESFDDAAAAAAAWSNQFGGAWTFGNGVASNTGTGNYGYLRRNAIDDATDLAVEARFVFHTTLFTTDSRIGVITDLSETDGNGQECWVDPELNRVAAQEIPAGAQTGDSRSAGIPALRDGDEVILVLRRDRNDMTLHCSATINGARTLVPVVTGTGAWPTMQHVAVQVRQVMADLSYVTIYTR